jgi:ferredoxin, 2Fe-2S
MPRVHCTEPDGREVELDLPSGQTVMRGAMDAGLSGIEAQCGGNCACATCHCYVAVEWQDRLKAPSEDERFMLGNVAAERRPNSRLCCQIVLEPALDGLLVQFPERQS